MYGPPWRADHHGFWLLNRDRIWGSSTRSSSTACGTNLRPPSEAAGAGTGTQAGADVRAEIAPYRPTTTSWTGLAKPRVCLHDQIDQAFRPGRGAQQEGFAILCLDLDRFKIANDTLGPPGWRCLAPTGG